MKRSDHHAFAVADRRMLFACIFLLFTALPQAKADERGGASGYAPTGPPPVSPDESVLSEYNPEAPPNPHPPPFTLLRFNEDYTYLADPRNQTDPFDPIKYIPLDPDDPKTYLNLGGELRERFEHFTNPRFGVPPQFSRRQLSAPAHCDPRRSSPDGALPCLCPGYLRAAARVRPGVAAGARR